MKTNGKNTTQDRPYDDSKLLIKSSEEARLKKDLNKEDIELLVTKNKFCIANSCKSAFDKDSPPASVNLILNGNSLKLYMALWQFDFGIGRRSQIGKKFGWRSTRVCTLLTRLCDLGFAYQLRNWEAQGGAKTQLWAIVFAEQIPMELRRISLHSPKVLSDEIQLHFNMLYFKHNYGNLFHHDAADLGSLFESD